jgi:excisionase family DNA binding protein
MASFSTSEAAKECGVHHITLQRWVSEGKIKAPRKSRVGGVVVRLWSDTDLRRIRKFKQENYRKGRGRKPKPKR